MKKSITVSMFDQAMLSAFNFGLGLLLIRQLGPELFGVYSIILAISIVTVSTQHAIIGVQLSVLRPKAHDALEEEALLATLWMANTVLMALSVLSAGICIGLILQTSLYPNLALAAALFVGATLLREYVRGYFFSELNPLLVLVLDIAFVTLATLGLILHWFSSEAISVASIFLILTIASVLPTGIALAVRRSHFVLSFEPQRRSHFRRIWRQYSGWALLGVLTTEAMSRAHVFIIGSYFGASAVGVLQAGAMIFRPLSLMVQAWERMARPTFARMFADQEVDSAKQITNLSAVLFLALSVVFMLLLWISWPLVDNYVFRGAYAGIKTVVVLWGVATAFQLVSNVYSTQLQGLAKFRELSLSSIIGAIIALTAVAIVAIAGQYEWSIMAIALGYLTDLVLVIWILSRVHASMRPRSLKLKCSTAGSITK